MRIYVGPWFWAAYVGLTAVVLLLASGAVYFASLMQQACT